MPHRSRISLDGKWQFWIDPENSLSPVVLDQDSSLPSQSIQVPAAWQSQSAELRFYSGAAWYQRQLEIPPEWFDQSALILGIEAADYYTEVWINEFRIGDHEGGYLPFEFDVTHAVRPGPNTLTIRVDDPPHLFPEIPHGKQGWYGPLSGIWQSVWLERRSTCHFLGARLEAERSSGWVRTQISLSEPPPAGSCVQARISNPQGESVASLAMPVSPPEASLRLALLVPERVDWSPEHPYLYQLQIELFHDGEMLDRMAKNFGFRTIEARHGKLYLNDEPIYLRGALDQDYYPDTIASPPSEDYLEDQISKAKALGLNCLRCHIKVADPSYYDVADRLGMLIWTELPNWSVFTERAGQRGRETLEGILERDGHHPSIIIWTIINENWGMDLVNDHDQRAWLKDTYHWLKSLDLTRLVVDNSACEPNFHIQTDIEDYHFYRAIPDHRREWDQFVQAFANRAPWTYCPNGLTERHGDEPLIVSEFGNWGLPDINLLADKDGQDPWWYETGFEWEQGIVYPQGVRSRFQNLGLGRLFGSWRNLVEATQWQQYAALKYQIEAMRQRPEIAGYVITELTDVHWECNGLLDMNRNPKVFQELFHAINADTVIIPNWDRVAYWPGESVQIGVTIAHGAGPVLDGISLHWQLEDSELNGHIPVPSISAGQAVRIGEVCFIAPDALLAVQQRLLFELRTADGTLLGRNHLDLIFYPKRTVSPFIKEAKLFTPIPELRDRLATLGYTLTGTLQAADAAVVGSLEGESLAYLRKGGRVLVLADRGAGPNQVLPAIQRVARKGTPWCGDWASSFTWINRQGVFSRFPGSPLIDHSFDRVIPEYVLTGFREWDYGNLVRAGMFVGWIHKPAAVVGVRNYGDGKSVLNTFQLKDDNLGIDPTTTILMDALLELTLC